MTTAASTSFASAELHGPAGQTLYLDGNSKITARNGTFDEPKPNAFSLPQIVSCPGRTPTCEKACYVHNLEQHQPELHRLYVHNLATIKRILSHLPTANSWAMLLGQWIRKNAPGGFRWHVSGDVFSYDYAQWIITVCANSPNVPHWIYTRSFDRVEDLNRAPNLTTNLSADPDNLTDALVTSVAHGNRICFLTTDGTVPEDLRPDDVIFPDYPLRGVGEKPHAYRKGSPFWQSLTGEQRKMVCPVDAYGKSEKVRCGPCNRCMT